MDWRPVHARYDMIFMHARMPDWTLHEKGWRLALDCKQSHRSPLVSSYNCRIIIIKKADTHYASCAFQVVPGGCSTQFGVMLRMRFYITLTGQHNGRRACGSCDGCDGDVIGFYTTAHSMYGYCSSLITILYVRVFSHNPRGKPPK